MSKVIQKHPVAAPLATTKEILDEARQGRMFILVDDENRENEGDLILPAQFVTPETINFMATCGRGLICLAMAEEFITRLDLPMAPARGQRNTDTAFTVSIGAAQGITTGISAADRAHTIKTAVADGATPENIVTPGHVFPLKAKPGGVLERPGHTEAAVDIARLADLQPASVICEIMKDDGTMARLPDLLLYAAQHDLKIGTIADLMTYREENKHGA